MVDRPLGGFDAVALKGTYAYNNAGQLEKVQKKQGTTTTDLVTNLDYAETGAPKVIAYGNGVTTTQTYAINYNYFLTHKETLKGTTKLQDISYSFDPAGNISQIVDASETQAAKTVAYSYDGLSRLTAATATNAANNQNYSQAFAYDLLGNITNKSDVGVYSYARNGNANPHAVTQAGTTAYAYDNNGNLSTDGTWTHSWDYKDRLLASAKTGTTVNYAYDEAGTRVTKTNATTGKTTTYVSDLLDIEAGTEKLTFYANGLKLATLEQAAAPAGPECSVPATGDWTVTADCTVSSFKTAPGNVTVNAGVTLTVAPAGVLALDLHTKKLLVKNTAKVLIRQGGAIAQTGSLTPPPSAQAALVFHHSDHLSGASVDTDPSGNIVQLTDYYPYGDSRIEEASGTFHNDYTYTGKERDEDTALLYYEARYYDSHLGRFILLDPWGGDINDPQSFNKYAYVRNNPLKYVDPEGMNPAAVCLVYAPCAYAVGQVAVDTVALGIALYGFLSNPSSPSATIETPVLLWTPPASERVTTPNIPALDITVQPPAQQAKPVSGTGSVAAGASAAAGAASAGAAVGGAAPPPPEPDWFGKGKQQTSEGRWKPGDAIDQPIDGRQPSWRTVRQRYWKNEASNPTQEWSPENMGRMRTGRAPQDVGGRPYELDHIRGRNIPNPNSPDNLRRLPRRDHIERHKRDGYRL